MPSKTKKPLPKTVKTKSQKLPTFTKTSPKKTTKKTPVEKRKKLPNVLRITQNSGRVFLISWRQFLVLLFFYVGLSVIFVRNPSLSSGSTSSGVFQSLLYIIFSLAIIWMLRETYRASKFTVRDGFYKGMAALIPFFFLLVLLIAEVLPLLFGIVVYTIVSSDGIAVNLFEKIIIDIACVGLGVISLYLVISSVFSIYIVTIPNMKPTKALRSSWQLVKKRRLLVFRKVLWMLVALVIIAGVVLVPIVYLFKSASDWATFIFSIIAVILIHSYMYSLYRELL